MIPVRGYKNRFVAVLGLGKTGLATEEALRLGGALPMCWDDDPKKRRLAEKKGINIANLKSGKVLAKADILIVSPGIPHLYPSPHPIVANALSLGIVIDNDISLFFRSYASESWSQFAVAPKVICVTGSNGKSTTVALLEHILVRNSISVEIGGNFGKPVLTFSPPKEGDIKILEISSYQAELARSLQPDLAVFLNFSPDHSDRHGGLGGYFAAKTRLFLLGGAEKCIIGVNELEGMYLANIMREEIRTGSPVITFSTEKQLKGPNWSIFMKKNFLVEWKSDHQIASIDLRKNSKLIGRHNHQNICAAYACSRSLGLAPKKIQHALKDFGGLKHRGQILGTKNNVLFVNDSKATNESSVSKSLNSFDNIRWIVGGQRKESGISNLIPLNSNVRGIYLIGSAQDSFSRSLGDIPHRKCDTLEKAFQTAVEDADPGDTILLAPACASFDQFNSFEDRGERFIELFNKI